MSRTCLVFFILISYIIDHDRGSLWYIRMYGPTIGFPGGSDGKEHVCNVGDRGSIPGSEKSLGGGHGNPLQYSGLENPMDRGV